jgi:dolichol-phosphate mannosyltransferase
MNAIVMLPTFKEAQNLNIIIPELLSIKGLSVMVVDDSSPDNTVDVISSLSKKFPNRIYLYQRKERGRATAGIFGFKKALEEKPDYIVEMDADLSHRPQDLEKMLLNMDKYDVVIGSRFVKGGKDLREQLSRHLLSQFSRNMYKLITGLKIEDVGSGFKCYKTKVIDSLLTSEFFSKAGTSICLEINFKIVKSGFKIFEFPIEFIDRIHGESKVTWKSFVEPIFIAFKLISKYGRI